MYNHDTQNELNLSEISAHGSTFDW